MFLYYSGTGNSRFAADFMAEHLGDTCLNIGTQIKAGKIGQIQSERPLVFVSPVYGWQLPRLFADYIRKAAFSGNKDAYFVLTCGSDIGRAGYYAQLLCRETGLNYRGSLEVVMPENYVAMFAVPEQEEARRIIEHAKPVLISGADRIAQGKPFPEKSINLVDRMKSGIVNDLFYKLIVKADPFFVLDSCVGCGKCVQDCVLNNIRLVDKKPVWGENCTHCMACICGCPAHAIEYGKRSRGKPRYQCPF